MSEYVWDELSLEERDHIIEAINDQLEYEYYFNTSN